MTMQRTRLIPAVATLVVGGLLAAGTASVATAADTTTARSTATAPSVPFGSLPPEEQEQLRQIAAAIWPDQAAGWDMNTDVADVLSQATGEILRCSEAFALVPRPPAFLPGLSYLRNYWKQLRDYFLVVKENRTYRICVVNVARNYRTAMEMASMGI
ncbi:hypothetical protein [Streptomyces spectabilis]|uniref:Uncharacterized protein n=1 Tax=Streptomyces spectabilis TaxID=68270 RepID=A0A5P2WZU6_STRST|nr:hypothetical protein [Streptomyces spectabilis]MBB5107390.1 hypothetical protein [Streptomyces spectabilis]MCI3900079.1 hypothetical protein [Streptomyces spectabilis]QEV57701.1 hypothetical protein CP982_02395 [Streptomyces spectabilis]GGV37302.1 hypothetical protein GCM10010245_59400 [Streptomyces spectabilis]